MTDLLSVLGDAGTWIFTLTGADVTCSSYIVGALAVTAMTVPSVPRTDHVPTTRPTKGHPMPTRTPPALGIATGTVHDADIGLVR